MGTRRRRQAYIQTTIVLRHAVNTRQSAATECREQCFVNVRVRHDEQRATHWQFGADVSQRCLSSLQQHLRALSFRPPNAYRGIHLC